MLAALQRQGIGDSQPVRTRHAPSTWGWVGGELHRKFIPRLFSSIHIVLVNFLNMKDRSEIFSIAGV